MKNIFATTALSAAAALAMIPNSHAQTSETPPVQTTSYFNHVDFDILLQRHVKPIKGSTQLDYAAFKKDEALLQSYLRKLSQVKQTQFNSWPKEHQLAFLINAYNAATIALILPRYPGLKSIRDIRSPWGQKFVSLFGKKFSLDNIEHDMIRKSGRYEDPRIHFAVNCASIGCPALAAHAYQGDILDEQLEKSTKAFLLDRSRNFVDGNKIRISNIFKWYRKDFAKGWRGANNLSEFLALYNISLGLNDKQLIALKSGDLKIKHTSYDWKLNASY